MSVPWKSGPDPLHHKMYVAFGYHRVSSRLKQQTWDLTWEQWRDAWIPNWHQRGRGPTDLCMARIDMDGPWTTDNIHLITRRQHGQQVRKHYQ